MTLRTSIRRTLLASAFVFAIVPGAMRPIGAAESGTGTIVGRVSEIPSGRPIAGAHVSAAAASGRYATTTDAGGRYTILGVAPDTYTIGIAAPGFEARSLAGVVVLPGSRMQADAGLVVRLRTIGSVQARGVTTGSRVDDTQDVYRVGGDAARGPVAASSSGLGTYTRGTVQGALAAVPGVQQDQFANVILQGGKVEDTVFSYDNVPVPQALIAEPGGNVRRRATADDRSRLYDRHRGRPIVVEQSGSRRRRR